MFVLHLYLSILCFSFYPSFSFSVINCCFCVCSYKYFVFYVVLFYNKLYFIIISLIRYKSRNCFDVQKQSIPDFESKPSLCLHIKFSLQLCVIANSSMNLKINFDFNKVKQLFYKMKYCRVLLPWSITKSNVPHDKAPSKLMSLWHSHFFKNLQFDNK